MKFNNEIWAFIPARSGSKSIKDKNIQVVKNKPLLVHSLLVAKKCKTIDKIIFSSDSEKYFNIAKKFSNFFFHKRKKSISLDMTTDLEVFYDFVKNFKGELPKFFVHLRPTTPFRNNEVLDKVINQFVKKEKKHSSLRSVSLMTNPACKSVVIKKNKLFSPTLKSFNLDKINNPRQQYTQSYFPNGYIDIIKTKSIFRGFLHGKRVMPYVNKHFVSDIDSLFDLKIATLTSYDKIKS